MGFWPVVEGVIRKADIIVLVFDARMPELSRNKEVERKVRSFDKQIVHAFTKPEFENFKSDIVFKFYGVNWCKFCQSFKQDWNVIKKAFKDEKRIKFVMINCEDRGKGQEECKVSNIITYPTLRIENKGSINEYQGERNSNKIIAHLKNLLK